METSAQSDQPPPRKPPRIVWESERIRLVAVPDAIGDGVLYVWENRQSKDAMGVANWYVRASNESPPNEFYRFFEASRLETNSVEAEAKAVGECAPPPADSPKCPFCGWELNIVGDLKRHVFCQRCTFSGPVHGSVEAAINEIRSIRFADRLPWDHCRDPLCKGVPRAEHWNGKSRVYCSACDTRSAYAPTWPLAKAEWERLFKENRNA